LYIDSRSTVHQDLTGLLRWLADSLVRQGLPLSELMFYDGLGPVRRVPLQAPRTPPAAPSSRRSPSSLLGDEEDAPAVPSDRSPAAPAASAGRQPIPDPRTVVATWLRELSSPTESRIAVLYYLDKLVPYSTIYQESERQLLVWLERLVNKITPNNRLILVALQDTLVPVELYTHAPNVFVHAIPRPDVEEREAYLRHRLGDLERADGLSAEQFGLLANLTDGLFLHDLDNLSQMIRKGGDFGAAALRRLLNRYRFGDQKDYFGQLDIGRISNLVRWFEGARKRNQTTGKEEYVGGEGVHGQTEAIQRIRDVLTVARAGLAGMASGTASKPKGVLFFAGPTGVGKTLVAKKLAKFLFEDENAYLRFDMSEFKEEHTVSKLIGSPPGYVGSEEGGMLTNGIRQKPFSVVLFDEIEKAHTKIMDIFLQILDEGRLTDSRGQTAFFTESIIVFTSNIGTRDQDRERLEGIRKDSRLNAEERKRRIREFFAQAVDGYFRQEISRPELLNRFGRNIIPFNFIDDSETQARIFHSHLQRIKDELEEKYRNLRHRVVVPTDLPAWLAEHHGPRLGSFGGRGIVNCLETEVILPLAARLLLAEHQGQTDLELHLVPSRTDGGVEVLDRTEVPHAAQ